ncbi:hypothetical protein M9Y82_06620 [Leptospira weilii]|uniref:hypothetical protein n=1 Tax=Leptospira weilii TaxID=28184 RepID=UPI0020233003|nr:hypothetical protein [Leptospira weilii]MCL8266326.1 hypothetical protein [Leptospira weilii]
MKSSEVYDSFTIRDEIGMLGDANVSDKKYLQTVRNAMEENRSAAERLHMLRNIKKAWSQ